MYITRQTVLNNGFLLSTGLLKNPIQVYEQINDLIPDILLKLW